MTGKTPTEKYNIVGIRLSTEQQQLLAQLADEYTDSNVSYFVRRLLNHPDFPRMVQILLSPNRLPDEEQTEN